MASTDASKRVLFRFVARAVVDSSGRLKPGFENPSITEDELIELNKDFGAKLARQAVSDLVSERVLKKVGNVYSFNIKKAGLFKDVYRFLYGDRVFKEYTADGFYDRSVIMSSFYYYMIDLERQGAVLGFSARYPRDASGKLTGKPYTAYYKAVELALDYMVQFGFLIEKHDGNRVRYAINEEIIAVEAPLDALEHQTHELLKELGIFSSRATRLSLHNIYQYIKDSRIRWSRMVLEKFPYLGKIIVHVKKSIDDESALIEILTGLKDRAFGGDLLAGGIVTPTEYIRDGKDCLCGKGDWMFDLRKKRLFKNISIGSAEMTVYLYRGLHDGLLGVPSMHVQINQESSDVNKHAVTYIEYFNILYWLDNTFIPGEPLLGGLKMDDFTITSVEYNVDILVNDFQADALKIKLNHEIKVQAYKILLRIYDMTSILQNAAASGNLGNFGSFGDITKLVESGLQNLVRFEERSTQPVAVKLVKEFLEHRGDGETGGRTHKTIISAMMGIETLAYHQNESARMYQANADRLYGIEMGVIINRTMTRNIGSRVEKIDESIKGIDGKIDDMKAGAGTMLDEIKKDMDDGISGLHSDLDAVSTRIDKQVENTDQLYHDFGDQITGMVNSLDGIEGELVGHSLKFDELSAGHQTLLTELKAVEGEEHGIRDVLKKQGEIEQKRLDFEKKKRQEDAKKEVESERKGQETKLHEKIEKIIDHFSLRYGDAVAREVEFVYEQVDVKSMSFQDFRKAVKTINDIRDRCSKCIVKKRFSGFFFDKQLY